MKLAHPTSYQKATLQVLRTAHSMLAIGHPVIEINKLEGRSNFNLS